MKKSITLAAALLSACAWASAAPTINAAEVFPLQAKHVHGSSIIQCSDGSLLACWFHGSGERNADDVMVQGSRLKNGESEWGPVFVMADTPGFPDCNPALYVDAKQRLWLFWIVVQANRWECCLLKYRRAEEYLGDGPPEWSWQDVINLKPGQEFADTMKTKFDEIGIEDGVWGEYARPYRELLLEAAQDPYKRQTGWMTRLHPTTLPSGRVLLGLYSDGFNISLAAISDDLGETWRASLPIVGVGPTQPSIVRKRDGGLIAYLRDSGDSANRVQTSTSDDDGETWSAALDTTIPNPDSSLEVVVLEDGNWVMILNDTEDGRHRLSAWLSDDEGTTWKWKRPVESSEPGAESFSYPSVIQASDGLIHITYSYRGAQGATIRHRAFNEEWIKTSE